MYNIMRSNYNEQISLELYNISVVSNSKYNYQIIISDENY